MKYTNYRGMANSCIPKKHDRSPKFLNDAEWTIKYAQKAENARLEFVTICRENSWMCECWKMRSVERWKMGNDHKSCPEDDNYIYVNPETPCPKCRKLLPNFNEV